MAAAEVNTILVLELPLQALQQKVVKIIAAELIIAVAGEHFGDVAFHDDDGDVEGAAAEVVDHGRVARGIPEAISQAGGGGLIKNAHHLQAGQHSGLARGVALGVREIGRHGDDGLFYALVQVASRPFHQLAKDEG